MCIRDRSIRFHYAYAGEQWVWKRPPFPQRWPPDGMAADGTVTVPEWLSDGAGPPAEDPPQRA